MIVMSSSVLTHPLNAASGCKLTTVLCTQTFVHAPVLLPSLFLPSSFSSPPFLPSPNPNPPTPLLLFLLSSSFLPHNLAMRMKLMEITFSSFQPIKKPSKKKKNLLALPQHQPCWVHSAPNKLITLTTLPPSFLPPFKFSPHPSLLFLLLLLLSHPPPRSKCWNGQRHLQLGRVH